MGSDTDPVNIMVMGSVFLALCPLIMTMRLTTRYYQKARFSADDWLALLATFLIIGMCIILIIGVKIGVFGYPTPPPPANVANPKDAQSYNFTVVEQLEWGFFMMQILSMGLIKLSFISFFRRIFVSGTQKTKFNVVTIVAMVTIVLWMGGFWLWFLFSCKIDFASRWTTVNTLHGTCPTDLPSDIGLAISDFLTDVFILFLPIPMVLKLQMKASRKLAVAGVFGLGALALVASIIRLVLFVHIVGVASGRISDPSADNNLLTTSSLYWSTLESGLALIACCMPTLTACTGIPVVRSVFNSMRRLSSIRSGSSRSTDPASSLDKKVYVIPKSVHSSRRLSSDRHDFGGIRSPYQGATCNCETRSPPNLPPGSEHDEEAGTAGIRVDRTVQLHRSR